MIAVADNPELAEFYGIDEEAHLPHRHVDLPAPLVAIGMFLYGTRAQVQPQTSIELMLFATVATIVGGIGNVWGAALAAIVLGVVQNAQHPLSSRRSGRGFCSTCSCSPTIIFFPQGIRLPERRKKASPARSPASISMRPRRGRPTKPASVG